MGAGESSEAIELSFPTEASLREVLEAALPRCASLPLPARSIARVAVIVEELLANIYDHGAMPPGGLVMLRLAMAPEGLRLMLQDPGRPYDPRDAPADAEVPERGGGAGLNLLRSWATIRSYEPGPPFNRLDVLVAVDRA